MLLALAVLVGAFIAWRLLSGANARASLPAPQPHTRDTTRDEDAVRREVLPLLLRQLAEIDDALRRALREERDASRLRDAYITATEQVSSRLLGVEMLARAFVTGHIDEIGAERMRRAMRSLSDDARREAEEVRDDALLIDRHVRAFVTSTRAVLSAGAAAFGSLAPNAPPADYERVRDAANALPHVTHEAWEAAVKANLIFENGTAWVAEARDRSRR